MSNFWDEISFANINKTASIDTSISSLTEQHYSKKRTTTYPAGIMVLANRNNGLVAPSSLPKHATTGEVVSVKTAAGNTTEQDGDVFVRWSGRSRIDRVAKEFLALGLNKRTASWIKKSNFDIDTAEMVGMGGDFADFMPNQPISMEEFKQAFSMSAGKTADLIHKSAEDLWSIGIDDKGEYEIERLFDDDGEPIKS